MRSVALFILWVAGPCFTGLALAAARSQDFAVPDHGTVTMAVPAEWTSDLHQPEGRLPPTVSIKARAGAPFEMRITILWPVGMTVKQFSEVALEAMVEGAAKSAEPQSVEGKLAIKPLSGAGGTGYYFAATDKAPKPDEFKFLTQGMLQCGSVTLAFTILGNDGQAASVEAALDMLLGARQQMP